MTWNEEIAIIQQASALTRVDPAFIAAIRRAEWGREGKEFGVLSVPAPTYADQLRVCCQTVRHRVYEFACTNDTSVFEVRHLSDGRQALALSLDFVKWFAAIWAPTRGAINDPHDLNANWATNVWSWYLRIIEEDKL